jgi:hypothetical protein
MIDLKSSAEPLVMFLDAQLAAFRAKHPEVASPHVALYSCPWSGWVSLCLDPTAQAEQNCPDFEFVEFAIFEAHEWTTEYEEQPRLEILDLHGATQIVEPEVDGDEALNRVFFEFLKAILVGQEATAAVRRSGLRPSRLGVQMLDSEYSSSWEPTARDGAG